MIICPTCAGSSNKQELQSCFKCGWELRDRDGLLDYLSESDRSAALFDSYSDNYEELAQQNLNKSNIDRRFLLNQAKNVVKYLGDVSGLQTCDIGIGQGFLCKELIGAGVSSVVAVDVAPSYLRVLVGAERVTPYLANAESLPFRDEFDLIVSTDVMEHVLNVGSFLYSVNRALRDGGVAAIRVPYLEPLLNYSPHLGYQYRFGHLRSFDKRILRRYFVQAGFRIRGIHLDGFAPGSPQPYLYSTPRRKKFYHRVYKQLDRYLNHPADATLLNPRLARLIMRPAEVVVIAEKRFSIEIGQS